MEPCPPTASRRSHQPPVSSAGVCAPAASSWACPRRTLAERTTLHWSYIGQVERGQRNLSLHNILRIAHALDTDAGGLVSGLEV